MSSILREDLINFIQYIQTIKSETDDIEVKSAEKGCPKIFDTLSSFSNKSDGGVIIFGIDENQDFNVVGVYNANDLQKNIKNQCNEMTPKVRGVFTLLKWKNGKDILALEVPEIHQIDKPCFHTSKGINSGSYIRVGDSDERMNPLEIYSLTSFRQQNEDDIRIIDNSTFDDLNKELIEKYVAKVKENRPNFSKIDYMTSLEKLGIVKKSNNEYKPTLAGLLCFGLFPDLMLPQLVITAVVVPGFEIGHLGELEERFIDNKKIIGTIPEMIEVATDFITRNMKKKTIIRNDDGKRDDKFEYPVKALREAIINSLVHRDYSLHSESSYISIRMFNDRLEISNPGGLYGGLTTEDLWNINNPPVRNKNIIRILEEFGTIENRSTGITTMIEEMRDMKLEPPIFEDKKGVFKVIFKNHNLMTKQDKEWLKNLEIEFSENEAYALVFIKNNSKITNGDYQRINNVNRDRALIELKSLISKDVISPKGIGSGTYYTLKDFNNEKVAINNEKVAINNKKVAINNEKITSYENIIEKNNLKLNANEKSIFKYVYENEYITTLQGSQQLLLSISGTRKLLNKMVEKSILTKEGNNKNRRYKINSGINNFV